MLARDANKFVLVAFVIDALVENILVDVELVQVALPPLVRKPVFSTQAEPFQRSVESVAVPVATLAIVVHLVEVPVVVNT